MSVITEFDIEKHGIINTIKTCNPGHYVTGYCLLLENMSVEKDIEKIKILLPKLLSWYDEGNYIDLMKSEYVYNKDIHTKTYELLKQFIKDFKISYIKSEVKVKKKEYQKLDSELLLPFPPYKI